MLSYNSRHISLADSSLTGLAAIVIATARTAMRSTGLLQAKFLQQQEQAMTKFALYVPLEAKPGKEKDVADFLRSAVPLVNAEPGTISWFAIQEGPSRFAIFDTFDDEAGRDAHLNGKVAAALMEKAKSGDLFAKAPEIHKLGIIADSWRSEGGAAAPEDSGLGSP
jgi:quinol monooxygenase YgiN